MIHLACTPIKNNIFSLFVLGATNRDNARNVHLDSGVYVCSSVKIFLVNGLDERFDFKYTSKGSGIFSSKREGKYKLEITSDMTLNETTDETPYFIEVISSGRDRMPIIQKAKVVIADG